MYYAVWKTGVIWLRLNLGIIIKTSQVHIVFADKKTLRNMQKWNVRYTDSKFITQNVIFPHERYPFPLAIVLIVTWYKIIKSRPAMSMLELM